MLKLHDYRSKAKGLPDLLPDALLPAPGIVLNKDGSFVQSRAKPPDAILKIPRYL